MSRRRRTTPAAEVLMRLRREAPPQYQYVRYMPAQDPWPWAWPGNPWTAPTAPHPLYEKRTER